MVGVRLVSVIMAMVINTWNIDNNDMTMIMVMMIPITVTLVGIVTDVRLECKNAAGPKM
jgi:hypothetical protein